ncbi:AAA family ATPase [Siccirubricoccus sp. KC 17139]|uniref:AAA family ATPase n=1 Tax=Siccirubricoccus soli TaxID=2899147 RepID=A0ABT1D000_9PROT|nr:AAA family ATPase [Siccirubricoccus soli]MCO6415212.1 AAA family ATPase [Siccirubricoccus soli]MCP2681343.1 AAA family ATPase [Siccirubricoccus soli]
MHLRAVELRDWRSYRHARFEFPIPKGRRNVILVRGPNEHGKTSFFEAVTLGLFGREGLFLVPRARVATNGDLSDRQAVTYSQFLAGVLHRRAIAQGRQSCSVTLEFDDPEGDPITLTRKWHFSANGQHKLYDDELLIFEGQGRRPVAPPAAVTDRDGWYRDFIAQTCLPAPLAEFFLFDGEQVQRYASRGMSGQVRLGVEGLLGLPVLKSLRESLQKYAQAKRASAAAPSDEKVRSVEADIARLEAEIVEERRKLSEATALLPALEAESDELVQRLGGGGEGTMAMVADLIREEERFRAEADRATDSLMKLLAEDVALALAGPTLRNETVARLRAEETREAWEAGRNQGNANLDRYVADLSRRLDALKPPIEAKQRDTVVAEVREAWHALWHPAPEGCAEGYLHAGLMGAARMQAVERLIAVGGRSVAELSAIVATIRSSADTADAKKRERLSLEQSAPEAERLSARLKEVSEEIGRLRLQRDTAERAAAALEGQLGSKRQEFGRYTDSIGRGAPVLRKATQAEAVARLIDDILEDAIPTQVGAVAEAMTKAWKSMAHMSDRVDRIEITPDCDVKMLNRKGENLHEIEKSAGASQVFTQALIWAVTHVSGQDFPFVVDTPLARLSRDQRLGVLKTFTDRPGQVILLSTDEEVVGDKLDAISDRILAAYQLRVRSDDGVAVTSVERDTV